MSDSHGGGSKIPGGALRFSIALGTFILVGLLHELNVNVFGFLPKDLLGRADVRLTDVPAPKSDLYKVTKVVDGDTLHILYNGVDEKLRLIGINTPETVDPRKPVQCFGKEASAHMKELAEGKDVWLEFDATQSIRDAYGRLLAYVYLSDGQMINRKMIADGYAYEYTYQKPYKYRDEFRSLQSFARSEKRGLWADNTCSGKL